MFFIILATVCTNYKTTPGLWPGIRALAPTTALVITQSLQTLI